MCVLYIHLMFIHRLVFAEFSAALYQFHVNLGMIVFCYDVDSPGRVKISGIRPVVFKSRSGSLKQAKAFFTKPAPTHYTVCEMVGSAAKDAWR